MMAHMQIFVTCVLPHAAGCCDSAVFVHPNMLPTGSSESTLCLLCFARNRRGGGGETQGANERVMSSFSHTVARPLSGTFILTHSKLSHFHTNSHKCTTSLKGIALTHTACTLSSACARA